MTPNTEPTVTREKVRALLQGHLKWAVRWQQATSEPPISGMREHYAEQAALYRAALDALEDAERLDWCADEIGIDQIGDIDVHEMACDALIRDGADVEDDSVVRAYERRAFRAAIDTARGAQEGR